MSEHAPGTTDEHLLLSKMTTPEGMADVVKSGVTGAVFENIFHRFVFDSMLGYRAEYKSAPTLHVLEIDFPQLQLPLPTDVIESTNWLIEVLRKRFKTNALQEIMHGALDITEADPEQALERIYQDAAEARRAAPLTGVPRLWKATDLEPAAQVRWLARGRLPRGVVSLLVGDEGIGKSLLWVWVVAAVTTGGTKLLLPHFGIPKRDPEHVLIAAITEDDWQSVVRPRLEVAGADMDMIQVVCTDSDGSGAPTFPRDLGLIVEADPKPALVVVDAWLDTVPKEIVVRDPQGARQALHPWKETATVTDAAIWLQCHTNRVSTANARDKYGITSELRKKARMTLFAQTDDEGRLVVGPDKSNMSAPIPASVFAIEKVQHFEPTADDDGTVPRLVYQAESTQTARELITEAYGAEHGNTGRGTDAIAWLAVFLANGPRWATDVTTAGKEAGFTAKRLNTAKLKLNAESDRVGSTGPWFWALPQHKGASPPQPDSRDGPVSDEGESEDIPRSEGVSVQIPSGERESEEDNLSTSQDCLIPNRETQGHEGNLDAHHNNATHLLGKHEDTSSVDGPDVCETSTANPSTER